MTMPAAKPDEAEQAVWERVCAFMLRQCGVVLAAEQSYLLAGRLGPVARQMGFPRVGEFVAAACAAADSHPIQRALIDAMTTHETSFFRDPTFWAALEGTIIPALRRQGIEGLRIWSAACSHGQEVYSLAMFLEEMFPNLWARSQVVATDISEAAVTRAAAGLFTPLEVSRGVDARRLARHFDAVAGGFRVKRHLSARITFGVHNLMAPVPDPAAYHLIFCRNVLIYFNVAQRRTTFERLCQATAAGGFIGLGTTEQGWTAQAAAGWFAREALSRGAVGAK